MADATIKIGDAKLAAKVIEAYADGLDSLTEKKCTGMGLDKERCGALQGALGKGREGIVTDAEREGLRQSGFSDEFIKDLAGVDGKAALRRRVEWLSDHAVARWWRWDARESDRGKMLEEIGEIGPDAQDATLKLIEALWDRDPDRGGYPVRVPAALAIGKIGPAAADAVPSLIKILSANDRSGEERSAVAAALGGIGPAARDAMPALIHTLRYGGGNSDEEAAKALGKIGPLTDDVVPALAEKLLHSGHQEVLRAAAEALGKFGPAAKGAVPALIKAVESESNWPRLSEYLRLLMDDDGGVCRIAIEALGKIGPEARDAVPALVKALGNKGWGGRGAKELWGKGWSPARESAIDTLVKIGSPAVPELIKALDDSNEDARRYAALALGRFGAAARDAVPALIKALGDENSYVSDNAETALASTGPASGDAAPSLVPLMQSKVEKVRRSAADAIVTVGAACIPELMKALKDDKAEMRANAADVLGRIGPAAKAAIPALVALNDSTGSDTSFVIAIGRIDPSVKEGVPTLISDLGHPRLSELEHSFFRLSMRRTRAIISLGRIGPAAKAAVPALVDLFFRDSYDSDVRKGTMEALINIGASAVPAFAGMLKNDNSYLRLEAANALHRIGGDAHAALPFLEEMRDNTKENPDCRKAAGDAVENILKEVR